MRCLIREALAWRGGRAVPLISFCNTHTTTALAAPEGGGGGTCLGAGEVHSGSGKEEVDVEGDWTMQGGDTKAVSVIPIFTVLLLEVVMVRWIQA